MKNYFKKSKPKAKSLIVGIIIFIIGMLTGNFFGGESGEVLVNNDLEKESIDYVVERVIDGDTIFLNGEPVRLIGINAPEMGRCFYQESKDALIELVLGEKVRLKTGVYDRDNFGRLLRYVFLSKNDLFVNDFMVDNGYADFDGSFKDKTYAQRLKTGRDQAKMDHIGIWAECELDYSESEDCQIKGNISKDGYGKIYFMPGDPNYERVQIDSSKGERYFCTEEEARDAGFRPSQSESQLKYMK